MVRRRVDFVRHPASCVHELLICANHPSRSPRSSSRPRCSRHVMRATRHGRSAPRRAGGRSSRDCCRKISSPAVGSTCSSRRDGWRPPPPRHRRQKPRQQSPRPRPRPQMYRLGRARVRRRKPSQQLPPPRQPPLRRRPLNPRAVVGCSSSTTAVSFRTPRRTARAMRRSMRGIMNRVSGAATVGTGRVRTFRARTIAFAGPRARSVRVEPPAGASVGHRARRVRLRAAAVAAPSAAPGARPSVVRPVEIGDLHDDAA